MVSMQVVMCSLTCGVHAGGDVARARDIGQQHGHRKGDPLSPLLIFNFIFQNDWFWFFVFTF